jgi:hypothetical protein
MLSDILPNQFEKTCLVLFYFSLRLFKKKAPQTKLDLLTEQATVKEILLFIN